MLEYRFQFIECLDLWNRMNLFVYSLVIIIIIRLLVWWPFRNDTMLILLTVNNHLKGEMRDLVVSLEEKGYYVYFIVGTCFELCLYFSNWHMYVSTC